MLKALGLIAAIIVGTFILSVIGTMIFAPSDTSSSSSLSLEEQKRECARAMMSNIGHSTTGYAEKMAYEAEVRSKCAGLSINGKPLDR